MCVYIRGCQCYLNSATRLGVDYIRYGAAACCRMNILDKDLSGVRTIFCSAVQVVSGENWNDVLYQIMTIRPIVGAIYMVFVVLRRACLYVCSRSQISVYPRVFFVFFLYAYADLYVRVLQLVLSEPLPCHSARAIRFVIA